MKNPFGAKQKAEKMRDASEALSAGAEPAEKLSVGVPLPRLMPSSLRASPEIVMLGDARSAIAERFRRLASRVGGRGAEAAQVLVVTSPAPGEGKSFVSLNLALAFANGQDATVLVDCDLRRPQIQNWLTPSPGLGLSELLAGQVDLDHVLLSLKNSPLSIVPAGRPVRDPMKLIDAESFSRLIEDLRRRFQRIIVDLPPIVPFTDAELAAREADGVLMVVRAGQTPRSMYQKALTLITAAPIVGTVLNDTTRGLADMGRYDDHYYSKYYEKDRRE